MTTEQREQHEPSMEEILSSIRRIIADEEAEETSADDDELGAAEAQAEAFNDDADALADAAEDEESEENSEDVLELTKMVRDSGEVVDLRSEGTAIAEPAAEPESEPEPAVADDEVELAPAEETPLAMTRDEPKQEDEIAVETKSAAFGSEMLSGTAASAATGAFARLSEAFQRTPPDESIAEDSGRTVEQFVEDMVRPLLKDWLDEHLPPIVERLVQKEIQKIARRADLA